MLHIHPFALVLNEEGESLSRERKRGGTFYRSLPFPKGGKLHNHEWNGEHLRLRTVVVVSRNAKARERPGIVE